MQREGYKRQFLHLHFGLHQFLIKFLKTEIVSVDFIFSGKEFHTCGPIAQRLLSPKLAVFLLCTKISYFL